MGKFGLFSGDREERMFQLLFKETVADKNGKNRGLTLEEVLDTLEREKLSATRAELLEFKKHAFEVMRENDKQEHLEGYILDSMGKIKILFDDLHQTTQDLMESAEEETTRLGAIREMREQLKLAMMKLGELQKGMNVINNGTIINDSNVVMMLRDMQTKWFSDMDASLIDGKIVFNTPTPEFLENYRNWERNKPLDQKNEIKVFE